MEKKLCVLIIFIYSTFPVTSQNFHTVTPTNNSSGIYFENVGILGKSTSVWKFLIHFDLSPFIKEEQILQERYSTLASLCNQLVDHFLWEPCKVTMKVINSTLLEVTENNRILRQVFQPSSKLRRGLVNGIGRLSKILFGTMDDEDADRLNTALTTLRKNQETLHHIINHRTSVLVNTVSTLNKNQVALNERMLTLYQNLSSLVLNFQNKTHYDQVFHLFDEVSNLMSFSMELIRRKQSELTDILHEARDNKLDKHLATSPLFLNAIKEVQMQLPHDLQFPLRPTTDNLQLYDKITKVEILRSANDLTLVVSIPLVSDFYHLYKLTPVPTKHNDDFYYFIKTNSDFIAINEKLKQYIFLNKDEFNHCTNMDENLYVCKQNFLIYNQNSQNCIVKTILRSQNLSTCEIRIFKLMYETWYPLLKPNTWLYVLPREVNLRIVCNDSAYSIKIFHSGVLELSPGCKSSTDQINLETTSNTKNVKQTLYNFNSNIFDESLKLNLPKNYSNIEIQEKSNLENLDLDKISVSLNELKKNDQELSNIVIDSEPPLANKILYSTLSLLILIIITYVIYFIFKKCLKCKVTITPQNSNSDTSN